MGNQRKPDLPECVLPPAVTGALVEARSRIEPSPGRRVAMRSGVLDRVRSDPGALLFIRTVPGVIRHAPSR